MSVPKEKSEKPNNVWGNRLTNTKDGIDIFRQILIALILLLFVVWPTPIQKSLSALHITKFGAAGWEFEVAQKNGEDAGDGAQRLGVQADNLARVQLGLTSVAQRVNNPGIKTELDILNSDVADALKT